MNIQLILNLYYLYIILLDEININKYMLDLIYMV